MATFPSSNDGFDEVPPLVARPAFAAITALWFALLLGLGMLALPATMAERLLPALNAPLGMGARGVISLFAGGIGALAGLALARLMARGHAGAARADHLDEPLIRPLNVRDELGDGLGWTEPSGEPAVRAQPAYRGDRRPRDSDLAELVERLHRAIEGHDGPLAAPARSNGLDEANTGDEADTGPAALDVDAELRASLARLRQLRGAV